MSTTNTISTYVELPETTFQQFQDYLQRNPQANHDSIISLAIAHFLTEQKTQNEQS